jgi:DNA polymerase I-like protein with 3'-5' exonuclease and polymerase domains
MIKVVTKRQDVFEDIGWYEFGTIGEVKSLLTKHKWIGFDIETTGLSFMNSEITAYQFGGYGIDYVIDQETVPITIFSSDIMRIGLVGQYLLFDIVFLYKHNIIPNKLWDTYLAEYSLTMGLLQVKRGLGALVKKYCNIEIDKTFQKQVASSSILNKEMLTYSATDTKYLIDIFNKQLIETNNYNVMKAVKLDCEFIKVLAYVEFCGIYLNTKKWYKIVRQIEYEEYKAELELIQFLKDDNVDISEDFNWGSSKQVEQLFREQLYINTFDKKYNKQTVQETHLLKQKHDIIQIYLNFKHKAKAVSTYGRNWFAYPFKDKRIHTKFNPIVRTGRTSCGQVKKGPFPNLQNIPASSNMRGCFEGQGPNRFILCDYTQQEKIVLADKSKEPALLKFFNQESGDLHAYAASLIFNVDIKDVLISKNKKEAGEQLSKTDKYLLKCRQEAKAGGFAIDFGGNGYTIANNLNIPKKKGEEVFNAYLNAFPGLKDYFKKTFEEAQKKGYILVSRKTGRKRFIDKTLNLDKIYRLSLNSPIQGEAAEIAKLAGIYIFKEIIKSGRFNKTKIVNFIHDEWIIEEHIFKAEATAKMVQKAMEDAGLYFIEDLVLKATPIISKIWVK